MDNLTVTYEDLSKKLLSLDTRLSYRRKEDEQNGGFYYAIDCSKSGQEICSSRLICALFSKENQDKMNKFLAGDCVLKFEEVPAGERSTRFHSMFVLLSKFFFNRLAGKEVKQDLLIEELLRQTIMKSSKSAEFWKLWNKGNKNE